MLGAGEGVGEWIVMWLWRRVFGIQGGRKRILRLPVIHTIPPRDTSKIHISGECGNARLL